MNRILASILLPMLLLSPTLTHAAETGEKWEQTVEMEMPGLGGIRMPATTMQFCKPKDGWNKPPSTGRDEACEVTSFEQKGNRIKWEVECKGEEPMTGEGEMTYSDDSFSGTSTLRMASGMEMRMKMKGRRLGGACEVGEEQRAIEAKRRKAEQQIAAAQRDSAKRQEESCENAARRLEYMVFAVPVSPCKDPRYVELLCSTAKTRKGLLNLDRQGPRAMQEVSRICGEDPRAVSARLCKDALRDVPQDDAFDYLLTYCPEEARALAKEECAGRSYTGMPSTYRSFCTEYASRDPSIVPAKAQATGDLKEEVKGDLKKEAAKKVLKGLFGR